MENHETADSNVCSFCGRDIVNNDYGHRTGHRKKPGDNSVFGNELTAEQMYMVKERDGNKETRKRNNLPLGS